MRLMIHSVRPGDAISMIGPDGACSEPFVLAAPITISYSELVWVWRAADAPMMLPRDYALRSTFEVHARAIDV